MHRKMIVDLKYTGSIDYIWQDFKYKEDTLQLLIYSYMHFKNTGEMLDAAYLIVESTYDEPVYQIREIIITQESYDWLEKFLVRVAVEPVKPTRQNKNNCLGGKKGSRCRWLEYCDAGRDILGGLQTVDFNTLTSKTLDNL